MDTASFLTLTSMSKRLLKDPGVCSVSLSSSAMTPPT